MLRYRRQEAARGVCLPGSVTSLTRAAAGPHAYTSSFSSACKRTFAIHSITERSTLPLACRQRGAASAGLCYFSGGSGLHQWPSWISPTPAAAPCEPLRLLPTSACVDACLNIQQRSAALELDLPSSTFPC